MGFAGPAVLASVAYMDPGNFATNIAGGAAYGYRLLWVVLAANMVAMLFQGLSARLGIVSGRNLAELSREHYPRALVLGMWVVAELAAMATDLAEFVGAALGLSLLTRLPLLVGMVAAGIITYGLLLLQRGSIRPLERVVAAMVVLIGGCYLAELLIAPVQWGLLGRGLVVPVLPDRNAVMLAAGIVGATVMPHAIYLHSGLTQARVAPAGEAERQRLLRFSDQEVLVALGFAGLVNVAMMAMAAAAFHDGRHDGVADIAVAYHTLAPLLGKAAAGLFLAALLASGLSSSVVGTMAGQMVMQGFLRRRVPLLVRRVVVMAPAFVVVLAGVAPTRALIASQVVLSLALPVPMLGLLDLMRRRSVMGERALRGPFLVLCAGCCGLILVLNAVLVVQSL